MRIAIKSLQATPQFFPAGTQLVNPLQQSHCNKKHFDTPNSFVLAIDFYAKFSQETHLDIPLWIPFNESSIDAE